MIQRILVIGATGLLGEPVAHQLQNAGFNVRVMSRHISRVRSRFPEPFEVVQGDALNRADIDKALGGCDAVHISIDHEQEDECIAQVIAAARAQQLQRITYVSGTSACEENRWFPPIDRQVKSAQAIRASGIDCTIFFPTWFMEMLAKFVRHGRAVVFGTPSRHWHFVSAQDFARMVTASYRIPEAVNKGFHVHGPQAFTLLEALQIYCRVLHPEIKSIRHLPYWLLRLLAWISGNAELKAGLSIVPYLEKVGESGDPTEANAILGAPQITLDHWLQMMQATKPVCDSTSPKKKAL